MSFSDWKKVNISETILSSNTGLDAIKRAPIVEYDSGIKCLRIQDISQQKEFKEWGFCSVEDRNYSKFQLKKGDIIVARTGATIGVNKLIQKDLKSVYNNGLIRIKVNQDIIDYNYLYYNMQSKSYKGHIQAICGGTSTQPNMKMNDLLYFKINLPPLEEQKVIADILSTLDEKIEVNNQINKNLEEMAQAIFKQWFVDFEFPNEGGENYKSSGGEMVESELGMIPNGWEIARLDEIANITMGQSPKGSTYNEIGEGVVFYQGRTDFLNRFPNRRLYTTEPKRMANEGDILMSVRAPVGDINIANEECCIGRGLCSLSSKDNKNSYLLYTMLELKEKFNVFNGEGTVFGSINQKDLKGIKIIKSTDEMIRKFDDTISCLDKQYLVLDKESRNLKNIRDTLLPKLMSGEIRVPLDSKDEVS